MKSPAGSLHSATGVQPPARSISLAPRAEMAQQIGRAAGNEIADRRAGEEAELGHRRDLGGKGQLPGEIGNDGEDAEGGIDLLPAKRRHMGDGQLISLEQDAPR